MRFVFPICRFCAVLVFVASLSAYSRAFDAGKYIEPKDSVYDNSIPAPISPFPYEAIYSQMSGDLKLSETQKQQLRKILDVHQERYSQLKTQYEDESLNLVQERNKLASLRKMMRETINSIPAVVAGSLDGAKSAEYQQTLGVVKNSEDEDFADAIVLEEGDGNIDMSSDDDLIVAPAKSAIKPKISKKTYAKSRTAKPSARTSNKAVATTNLPPRKLQQPHPGKRRVSSDNQPLNSAN